MDPWLTIEDFERTFRNVTMPALSSLYESNGQPDYPARRETWNDTIDAMVTDGILPRSALDVPLPDDLDG